MFCRDPISCSQEQQLSTISAFCAWHDAHGTKIARFGHSIREVAVTSRDKVEAQICLGYSVNGYSFGDLVECVKKVTDAEIDKLIAKCEITVGEILPFYEDFKTGVIKTKLKVLGDVFYIEE